MDNSNSNFTTSLVFTFLLIILFSVNLPAQAQDLRKRNFIEADSIAALFSGHPITNLYDLSRKLTDPLPDQFDKFRAIYKWVCDNIENDPYYFLKNKEKREAFKNNPEKLAAWNRELNIKVFDKLLKDHKTICTGYAYLIKELANYAGINCVIVDGYGRTTQSNIGGEGVANHSWNAVELNGEWFLCDPTWSSGAINLQEFKFIKQFEECYFLTEPSLFVGNHYPLDSRWLLLDTQPTLKDFLNAPLLYKGSIIQRIQPISPQVFEIKIDKGKKVSFQFLSNEDLTQKKLALQIINSGSIISVNSNISVLTENTYAFDYTFKSKGIYEAHILMDGEYLFTYSVRSK